MSNKKAKTVEAIVHSDATRKVIPSVEHQAVMPPEDQRTVRIAYERRDPDLDPQLVWRGKDGCDWSQLVVTAPPLYIEERVHPKSLVDDLLRVRTSADEADDEQLQIFADFNGVPDAQRTEFYQHDANWSNRMILGDSLAVMASLAEREGLRGQVQCIYLDPPYGIKFNSNFQWSTKELGVKDGVATHITRQPEQVKAFRDTWQDGVHSYLTYLRDRLTVARDLLTPSGSVFLQIGSENVHRVRVVLDEIFGPSNCVSMITYRTSSGTTKQRSVKRTCDYILWYCKDIDSHKFRRLFKKREVDTKTYNQLELSDGTRRPMLASERIDPSRCPSGSRPYQKLPCHSPQSGDHSARECFGAVWEIPHNAHWRHSPVSFSRLLKSSRITFDKTALRTISYHDDHPASELTNNWDDTAPAIVRSYVVQTSIKPIERCILMSTDPGDLVLDPTCGSGTSAYVAEKWGRRWITVDTSRVALALARARLMGAQFPYFVLSDSLKGRQITADLDCREVDSSPTGNSIRQGFVYRRVSHIQLRHIGSNAEIDEIWSHWESTLDSFRTKLNAMLGKDWAEWEVPTFPGTPWPEAAASAWQKFQRSPISDRLVALKELNRELSRNYSIADVPEQPYDSWDSEAVNMHARWWEGRRSRQREIDGSTAKYAEYEYLYDEPFTHDQVVRVSGPFTVETLTPHRILPVDENDRSIEYSPSRSVRHGREEQQFIAVVLENLKRSGVQQIHRDARVEFSSINPWPGEIVCAEGRYIETNDSVGVQRRAAILIGPEFGTVQRNDLVRGAREAGEAGFDLLVACAFNYDAHASEFSKLGRVPIVKARMNADLHMAKELKSTGHGNLFVVFGEPDVEVIGVDDVMVRVQVNGVDIYVPSTGEVRPSEPNEIACWFIDTDYNDENFFVRHAYFLGTKDPYNSLKAALRSEINKDTWQSLCSRISRPFRRPESGRVAVKVINHLGDEVMKILQV